MKWFVFICLLAFGTVGLRYTYQMARFFGQNAWAEKQFGSGGTYTFWRLLALGCIIFGFLILQYPGLIGLK